MATLARGLIGRLAFTWLVLEAFPVPSPGSCGNHALCVEIVWPRPGSKDSSGNRAVSSVFAKKIVPRNVSLTSFECLPSFFLEAGCIFHILSIPDWACAVGWAEEGEQVAATWHAKCSLHFHCGPLTLGDKKLPRYLSKFGYDIGDLDKVSPLMVAHLEFSCFSRGTGNFKFRFQLAAPKSIPEAATVQLEVYLVTRP